MQRDTQQDVLKRIVNENIAPAMKELGFKRKGRRFTRVEPYNTKELNIYSSRWNTKDEASFTVELRVNQGENEIAYKRVPELMTGRDNWYTLNSGTDSKILGKAVHQDIQDYATQFFNNF